MTNENYDFLDGFIPEESNNTKKEECVEIDEIFDYSESVKTAPKMSNGLELTKEFEDAFLLLENSMENVYLTGNAGSGKSTFLRYWLSNTKKRTVVLSPTGMGAINLQPIKASTIHRFFGFRPVPLVEGNIPRISEFEYGKKAKIYQQIDTIIIDECSMVSSMMLQAIDLFYRINFDSDEPFGGKQMVLVGDLAQLPPVVTSNDEKVYIDQKFGSRYFFDAEVLKRSGLTMISLNKIFRQKDEIFVDYLNKIRRGTITTQELNQLNQICYKTKIPDDSLIICTTNNIVQFINSKRLEKIKEKEIVLTGEIEGSFNMKNCPVEEIITVKKGCKIMCRNNDINGNWVNGTFATFLGRDGDHINIEINGKIYQMEKFKFEQSSFTFDSRKDKVETKVSASFTAFPICLAYAITIHKSQGATYDQFKIDIGRGAFDHGMLYVALSRGTSMDGINFINPVNMSDVIIDKKISDFYKRIGN